MIDHGFGDEVGAELLGRARGSVQHYAGGRPCQEEGCTTILSIYNDGDRCARHEFRENLSPVPPGRRPAHRAAALARVA